MIPVIFLPFDSGERLRRTRKALANFVFRLCPKTHPIREP